MKFTFVFACEKIEERNIYTKIKLGGYDFPHPRDGSQKSPLF
jgi:hypothetical protein